MKLTKYTLSLLFVLFSLFSLPLQAEIWTPENLPMVHLQDSTRFVCNPDGVLSSETVAKTDAILRQLKRTKGVETVVVAVKKIKDGDPYQFGMDLSRKYGIGDKEQRTGLIIILSTEDRAYQFLTGNGLEGTLPDGLCYNIQQTEMVPHLKEGNWDEAIYASVVAVNGVIMGDESITRRYTEESDDTLLSLGIAVVLVVVFVIFGSVADSRKRKCPKCKTRNAMVMVRSRRVRIGSGWYTKSTWKCKKCGHIVERNEEDTSSNSNSSGPGFPLFGGGSSGGGGGFGGGSFGGGSFGGGGSGGKF